MRKTYARIEKGREVVEERSTLLAFDGIAEIGVEGGSSTEAGSTSEQEGEGKGDIESNDTTLAAIGEAGDEGDELSAGEKRKRIGEMIDEISGGKEPERTKVLKQLSAFRGWSGGYFTGYDHESKISDKGVGITYKRIVAAYREHVAGRPVHMDGLGVTRTVQASRVKRQGRSRRVIVGASIWEMGDAALERYRDDIIGFADEHFWIPERNGPIVLEDWQKDEILKPLFYDRGEDGLRRHNLALVSMPKKNGKSTLAAIAIVHEAFFGELAGEIILAANDKEQSSWVIFKKAKWAIDHNPALAGCCDITRDEIKVHKTGTVIRVIAQDYSSAAGMNPSMVIFDELWGYEHSDAEKFFDELTTVPTRKQPLTLIVTYAGFDDSDSLLRRLYDKGMRGSDEKMFFYWTHENKASWVTPEYLAQQRKRLRLSVYLRLHENRFTSGEKAFFDMDVWDKCVDDAHWMPMPSKAIDLYVGVDVSVKHDRAAVTSVYHDPARGKVLLGPRGWWQPTPEEPLDLEKTVEGYLLELNRDYRVVIVNYDPYQFHRSAAELRKSGLRMEEFSQSLPKLTEMSQNLYNLVHHHNIVLYSDGDLRAEALKTVGKETGRAFRIVKDKATHKIDSIVALAMAALPCMKELGSPKAVSLGSDPQAADFASNRSWRNNWGHNAEEEERQEKEAVLVVA